MYMAAFDKELAKLHKYKFNTNVFQISLEIKKISLVPIGRKNFQIFFTTQSLSMPNESAMFLAEVKS